ncbi:MAG: PqqD family peptide modification chaperone [Allosphingosinicella sp.]
MPVGEELIASRRSGLIEAEVDGEMVALHVENGTCYGFNGTATRIWAMLDAPKRVSELRDALLEEYDVDPETCEAQLIALLRELERDGLVALAGAPSA